VCTSCRSVVKNLGQSLELHGKISEVREDATPFCVGTTGTWQGRRFTLAGRLQIRHQGGLWNEWFLSYDDDGAGGKAPWAWLAEAMGFLAVLEETPRVAVGGEGHADYGPGQKVAFAGEFYTVKEVGKARVIGGEGSLPMAVGHGWELPFVDFASFDDGAATLDFSGGEKQLYVGKYVQFGELAFQGLRESLPPDHPMARVSNASTSSINCPSCGGGLERKTGLQGQAFFCPFCGGGIDVTQEPHRIFQQQDWSGGFARSTLKLSQTGEFEGHSWTVLAMQERHIRQWNVSWLEYLLHSDKAGYRWLAEQDGHFTWVEMMPGDADTDGLRARIPIRYAGGKRFKEKETNATVVTRVAGELYFRVEAGDEAVATDFMSPPYVLSKEVAGGEQTWSVGRYLDPKDVRKAFGIGLMPDRVGYLPHQPPPMDRWLKPVFWRWLVVSALLLVWSIAYSAMKTPTVVASDDFAVDVPLNLAPQLAQSSETPEVLAYRDSVTRWYGPFEVPKGPTALMLTVKTDIAQGWLVASGALVNDVDGTAVTFDEGLSFYSGPDWSEGDQIANITFPSVPAGSWSLRFEPVPGEVPSGRISVSLSLVSDVALTRWMAIAFAMLTFPLFLAGIARLIWTSRRDAQDS